MSQLKILEEKLSQEDVNQKLSRSLSSEWNTHVVVWRNKSDLDTMSMVDLYNNLKVYEPEVKGISSSSSSTHNMDFVSSLNNNTSSTNGAVNTAQAVNTSHRVSTASTQVNTSYSTNIDNLSDAVICSFFAIQQNTFVSCDGLGGYDWSDQAEEGPNYALMAFLSSSSDSKTAAMAKTINGEGKLQALVDEKKVIITESTIRRDLQLEDVEDNEKEDVSQPKIEKKTVRPSIAKIEFVKSKQQKKTTRKTVKQFEQHRENTDNPRGNQRNWNNIMSQKLNPKHKFLDHVSKHNSASLTLKKFNYVDAQGRSKYMTGNMFYLKNYEKIDGGYVAFGGNSKGGKITGKDDYSRFTWVFFLATKDETSGILKSFITGIKNLVDHKDDEGFFVGYSLNSKAFRVFNSKTRIVKENLHIRFSESTPNVVGSRPDWLLDIDALTRTINYEPIVAGILSNGFVDPKSSNDDGFKPSSDDGKKVDEDPRKENEYNDQEKKNNVNNTNNVNTALNRFSRMDERRIVIRNKARLVAQGYTQEEGIDYDEVFFPVARIETIRLFLAYALLKDFMMYPMDVKSVFLYEKIEKEVYLKGQPKLGLWYPKDSLLDLVAYTDSDYARASLDRKSTTGDGKEIVITESSVRRDLQLADEEDEVVYKELGDSLVRAATTASSLKEEQDSGGGPRCQETIGDTIAQTKYSNNSLLLRGITLQSDEDSMKLDELMTLCTNIQNRVLDLEKTKTTQRNEINSLKRRVKKLEKRNRSRTHKLKRLYKVGLSARVEFSRDEESLDKDASKQGRRIHAIDADEDITLVNDVDNDMFDVDVLGGEEVFVVGIKKFKTQGEKDCFQDTGKPTTTTTISSQQLQDKGKGIMIEEHVKPKKKDQIRFDEEAAKKLQAKFDEEERLTREKAKKEERANIALIET
nr:hypothetical protein [Tanacetum cinerariifolium]